MKRTILSWIGIAWGTFILVTGVPRLVMGRAGEGTNLAGQIVAIGLGALMLSAGIRALLMERRMSTGSPVPGFAARYTAAWCSQNAASVAASFAKHGSLTINGGIPSVGRTAITAAAQGFMTAFPDMVVTMDRVDVAADEGRATYHWTLTGTNTGPGGTGRRVRISGYEEWVLGADGLIVDSQGHFDADEYQRQLGG